MIRQIKNFFITTFIGGVVVILPIAIFIFLIKAMFNFVARLIKPISEIIDFGESTDKLIINLVSISIVILFCFLVGLFVRTQFGKGTFNYIENQWLSKLPFYSTIKETVQQFTGKMNSSFSRVVLVDVFNNGTRMTGFVTDQTDEYYTVFVPTAPNPTNGFIFHVKHDQVEFLDTKTEEAMRTVIAVGSGSAKTFFGENGEE